MTRQTGASRSKRIYARLFRVLPLEFLTRFGADIIDLFRDQLRAARAEGGVSAIAVVWFRAVSGLLSAAAIEHLEAARNPHTSERSESMLDSRPLPGAADAGRLVRLERKEIGTKDGISASYPFYEYLRDRTHTLDGLVAWGKASLAIRARQFW